MNKALVVGGFGVTGSHIVAELLRRGWGVTAIARRTSASVAKALFPASAEALRTVQLDVANSEACRIALAGVSDVSHVFHCARMDDATGAEHARINGDMLVNVVNAVEAASPGLAHVSVMHGMKAYGTLLGEFKTPAHETDPRVPGDLSYYVQEDYLNGRQQGGAKWTWSTLRPGPILGITLGYSGNLVQILGVYGSMCKALGMPLWFPGSLGGFHALRQACDAKVLARAAIWASTTGACRNQVFNVSNGDTFRWARLWPAIAEFFGIEAAPPIKVRLRELMRDRGPTWDAIVRRHNLDPHPYDQMASWGYGDTFHNDWDSFASDIRLRSTGFADVVDTKTSLLGLLELLRQQRIIP